MTINTNTIPAPDFSNGTMKVAYGVLANLGCGESPFLKNILESGGYGVVPGAALVDDVLEFRKKAIESLSVGNLVTMSCIGSEITFDLYEVASSVAQTYRLAALEQMCIGVSSHVMTCKILGSLPLAVLAADEAYARIFETRGFTGFAGNLEGNDGRAKIRSALRALEVGCAALSNVALSFQGTGGFLYAATSMGANVFKFLRIGFG